MKRELVGEAWAVKVWIPKWFGERAHWEWLANVDDVSPNRADRILFDTKKDALHEATLRNRARLVRVRFYRRGR